MYKLVASRKFEFPSSNSFPLLAFFFTSIKKKKNEEFIIKIHKELSDNLNCPTFYDIILQNQGDTEKMIYNLRNDKYIQFWTVKIFISKYVETYIFTHLLFTK